MRRALLLVALLAGVEASLAKGVCRLQPASPQRLAQLAGGVVLEGSDGTSSSPLWLGPIRAPHCRFDPGLFAGPLAIAQQRYLFVLTVSGSQQRVTQLDWQQCRQVWQSAPMFGSIRLLSQGYRIGRRTVRFDAQCRPLRK